jgi:hypothetical protein
VLVPAGDHIFSYDTFYRVISINRSKELVLLPEALKSTKQPDPTTGTEMLNYNLIISDSVATTSS